MSEEAERQTEDVPAAAQMLGVRPKTLYRAIARGDAPVPVIKVGDRLLIPKAALERLVTEGPSADVDAAREYLAAHLPAGEPVEVQDPDVLDAAAAVIVNGNRAS